MVKFVTPGIVHTHVQNPNIRYPSANEYEKYYNYGTQHKTVFATKEDGVRVMHEENYSRPGINFALLMKSRKGYTLYNRPNQPCQGGETRRYGESSTRPKDPRPTDLHMPFPDGKPVAMAVGHPGTDQYFKQSLELLFADDSPWASGFGGSENVEITTVEGKPAGFVLTNTKYDSTVWMNFMRQYHAQKSYKAFGNLLEDFPDYFNNKMKLLWFTTLGYSGAKIKDSYSKEFTVQALFSKQDGYGVPTLINVARFMNSQPHALSGGLFIDKFDYNRPDMVNVFKPYGEESGINVFKELTKKLPQTNGFSPKYFELFAELIQKLNIESNILPTPKIKGLVLPESSKEIKEAA